MVISKSILAKPSNKDIWKFKLLLFLNNCSLGDSLFTDSLKLISGYFKKKNKSTRNLSRKHFKHLYFACKFALCEKVFINFRPNKIVNPSSFRYMDYLESTLKYNTDLFFRNLGKSLDIFLPQSVKQNNDFLGSLPVFLHWKYQKED